VKYVQRVSQVRDIARRYWFRLLVAVLTIAAMLEVVLGRGSPGAPDATLWFCVPAIATLVLPVFACRRFPFAGPAVYWLLAAGISVVDPLLIPYADALFPIGMADAFLLGNLRDARRAALGLVVVVVGASAIASSIPGHSASQPVVVPLEFAISWVAGFAVRGRAVQAEAAESRATQAERERDIAARIAAAEERTRIARELHDIVAHAVSVMVLQVGAVRHELPAALSEDPEALKGVEQVGRDDWRRCVTCWTRCVKTENARSSDPSRASTVLTRSCETSGAPGSPCGCTSIVIPSTCPTGSTSPHTGLSRKASPTCSSTDMRPKPKSHSSMPQTSYGSK
jgi:signal transduction histidine kinase